MLRLNVELKTLRCPIPRASMRQLHITDNFTFVEREMRAYLSCGILACGFLRLQCESCGKDGLLPLTPWRDGTTHAIFEPLQFLEKLCALVPTPRAHTVRYHGILGPAAKWRGLIVPNNATTAAAPEAGNVSTSRPASTGADPPNRSEQMNGSPAEGHPRNYLWSELMKRVFAADVLTCDHCGGRLRIVATIRPPETTRKILDHLGLPSRPPPLAPAAFQELPFVFE